MSKSYEQLVGELQTVIVDGTLYFIAEGDLLLTGDELQDYARPDLGPRPSLGGRRLVVIHRHGQNITQPQGITMRYCVVSETFADETVYTAVAGHMAQACRDWQSICNVRFEHVAAKDAPGSDRSDLLFVVRYVDHPGTRTLASAFFPDYPPERRHVLIFPGFLHSGFSPSGVLRHELGHVLGFRHEHIRSEAPPECPDESLQDSKFLSQYDPRSIMHYFCGRVGSRELEFSEQDIQDAQAVYGPPEAQ